MPRPARLVAVGALAPLIAAVLVLVGGWDASLTSELASERPGWAIPLMVALTTLGSTPVLLGVVGGMTALVRSHGRSAGAIAPLLAVPACSSATVTLVKLLVARPRGRAPDSP
ncbi:MAG: hypothetical protein ACRD0K_11530 [Egibacteraceae bacterium]